VPAQDDPPWSAPWLPGALREFVAANPLAQRYPALAIWPFLIGAPLPPGDRFDPFATLTPAAAQGYFNAFALYGMVAAAAAQVVARDAVVSPSDLGRALQALDPEVEAMVDESAAAFAGLVPGPWQPSTAATRAFLRERWAWSRSAFEGDDLVTGRFLTGLAGSDAAAGLEIARDTLLGLLDVLTS
jgi:hypothetical protein